jgi:hypothetical protein
MAVEIFSRERFENALPKGRFGEALWRQMGLDKGEYQYTMPVREGVAILIRSSVRADGKSADRGKDSIRAWIVDSITLQPLSRKLKAYTTRAFGWEVRLIDTLRKLWAIAQRLPECPDCKKPLGYFIVKKEGPNKGREFRKCATCGKFEWVK